MRIGMGKVNQRKVSVIGLGYVGLPVAAAFGQCGQVVGYDLDTDRLIQLREGHDITNEISSENLRKADIYFTNDPKDLSKCDFHIVAVPTPVDASNLPDLGATLSATRAVGSILKKGDIVVYESTFYPGVTEEDCLPLLEKTSGLTAGRDFFLAYSPERVNPGDPLHTFTKIKKVVAAQDPETLEIVAQTYSLVVEPGVYKAQSIRVAEACKVIENSQRDINIAFLNEVSVILSALGIDTHQVIDAAATKWNFAHFRPGLVGGHCIGVDPYYIIEKGRRLGIDASVLKAARSRNESMADFIAQATLQQIKKATDISENVLVTILGFTFKENCPDVRNTKVHQIYSALKKAGVQVQVFDPLADPALVTHEYGMSLTRFEDIKPATAIVLAVSHSEFKEMSAETFEKLSRSTPILMDVKGLFPVGHFAFTHWRP